MSERDLPADPVPEGRYAAVITAADIREGGTAPILQVEATVGAGRWLGRTVRGLASFSDRGMEMPGGPLDLLEAIRDRTGDPPYDLRSGAGMAWLADAAVGCDVEIEVLQGPLIRSGRPVRRADGSLARRSRIRRYHRTRRR